MGHDEEDRMLGVQLLANGLVNLDLLARAWAGRRDEPAPPAGPEDDPPSAPVAAAAVDEEAAGG